MVRRIFREVEGSVRKEEAKYRKEEEYKREYRGEYKRRIREERKGWYVY